MALQIPTARVFLPLLYPSRYKGAHGGRGSGKSHFFAEQVVERCLIQCTRVLCIREHQRSLKQSSKLLIEDKIQSLGVGKQFNVTTDRIDAPYGGMIVFEGMQNHTAESVKSFQGFNIAWCEEAQSLSQRSVDLLEPTIREPESEIWFSWNPESPKDAVDKLLRGSELPPDSVVVEANYTSNPWFPDVLRKKMEWDRRRDPAKYAHIWLGQYALRTEAQVFKNWRIGTLDIPKHARPYFGADWGFAIDPTVLLRLWVWDRTIYIDKEVSQVGCEIDRTPALFDTAKDDLADPRKWTIVADSARPETISYMARNGYPKIESARKGPNSVLDGVEFLKSYDIVVHPSCRGTSDELSTYSYEIDKHTDEVLPELIDKDNHRIDAARYALEKLRRSPVIAYSLPFSASVERGVPG